MLVGTAQLSAAAQRWRRGVWLSETNRARVDAMWRLRTHLIVAAWVSALAVLSLFVCLFASALARRYSAAGQ